MTQTILKLPQYSSQKKNKYFHVGSLLPITEKNNSKMFFMVAEAICELGYQISVLAEGDANAQKKCMELHEKYPTQFEILESVPKNHPKILNHVDVIIFPSEPTKELLKIIMKKGIVPIMPKIKGFEDFNPQKESGNAFLFQKNNFWEFLACLVRASENHKFSYDWQNLQKSVKNTVL